MLRQIAKAEEIKGCTFMSDIQYATHSVRDWDACQWSQPYYIAFRQHGVEEGTKQHVMDRCAVLGQPHIAVQLTHENGAITMKINAE